MALPRRYHTATLLADGRVLAVGGLGSASPGLPSTVLRSAELYDPATGSWTSPSTLVPGTPRMDHTATRLADGRVLVVGGFGAPQPGQPNQTLATAELYDPATGSWRPTGGMALPRRYHSATLLADGRVLVAGGHDGTSALASAELYDPTTGTWTVTSCASLDRRYHTATRLPDGRVLVTGGIDSFARPVPTERYRP
ncbi:MAG TPA: kelch repeat-containing protein [Archangium sp.]